MLPAVTAVESKAAATAEDGLRAVEVLALPIQGLLQGSVAGASVVPERSGRVRTWSGSSKAGSLNSGAPSASEKPWDA
eukprot:11135420-Heterocapsa_arctica.AAC.1